MKFQFMNAENTQVQGTLEDEGERFGYHPPQGASFPFVWSLGMAPGNLDFDTLFPNAKAEWDATAQAMNLLDMGEPAHPIADYVPPPPGPVIVAKFDFWDRLTEKEAENVEDVIATRSVKERRAFETAQTFRSDSPLWDTLVELAEATLGKERAKEVLAPSAG